MTTLAVPYDAFADKITAAVPRGKGPDIFIYAQDRLGGWIEAGKTVEPIDFFLDKATTDRFIPTTMEAMTYRGTVYGLPLNYKVITLIYNKKLVPTPPKTSKELVAMAKKLTDAKSGRFGLAYSYSDFYYHAALQNAFGGRVFDPGPKPVLNAPENVKALELLMRWFTVDGILPAEPSTALITSLFNGGKAAMVFSGPWFLGEIAKEIDFGLAPLPTIDEAGGKPMRPWMTVEGRLRDRPVAEQGRRLRLREVPHRHAAGEGDGRRGAPDAREQGRLLRPGRLGRRDPLGVPQAGRGRRPDAEPPGDDDGLVAGHDGDEHDRQEVGDAEGGDGPGAEGRAEGRRRPEEEVT